MRPEPADRSAPILPPAVIGILGGGQLGRMLGMAARAMGYRIVVLDPDPDCPAAAVADKVVPARYDDVGGALRLADLCDVVTYELEHIAADTVRAIEPHVPVRPGVEPLVATQDRLAERRFVESVGVGVALWREVRSVPDARSVIGSLDPPLRLKVPVGGYDGRGQIRITTVDQLDDAWERLGRGPGAPLLAERELDFECELSVVVARGADGTTATYPVSRNRHDEGILVETVAPAPIEEGIAATARAIGTDLAVAMDLRGTLTAELFLLRDGSLVVNELAPRVHNSGHWTIEGARTSQFENHLRALLGLPLGDTRVNGVAAMVNLIGETPDPASLLEIEGSHLHLYGKPARPGRKLGHVTLVEPDRAALQAALARVASVVDEPSLSR
ncbi:MAG TPA: 5-(carboxyamino)imidazole ribonucleotide synthase [Actinomycetota bacterium]|nr:5-(carboxyamino)imidazole ribonucleotide synthase [Actinomycetota bacterium]